MNRRETGAQTERSAQPGNPAADAKTRKNTVMVEFEGRVRNLRCLAAELGFPYGVLYQRLREGMTVADAAATPPSYRPKLETRLSARDKFEIVAVAGHVKQSELARLYGVSQGLISRVIRQLPRKPPAVAAAVRPGFVTLRSGI